MCRVTKKEFQPKTEIKKSRYIDTDQLEELAGIQGAQLIPVSLQDNEDDCWDFKRCFLNEETVCACVSLCACIFFFTCISVKLGADCVLCRISRLCNNRLSSVRLDWHRASSENKIHNHTCTKSFDLKCREHHLSSSQGS